MHAWSIEEYGLDWGYVVTILIIYFDTLSYESLYGLMLFQTHIISFFFGDTNKKTPLQRETKHHKAMLTPNRSTKDPTPTTRNCHKKFTVGRWIIA